MASGRLVVGRRPDPQGLAMLAWAYATLRASTLGLWEAIKAEAFSKLRHIEARGLSALAWAFAVARTEPNGANNEVICALAAESVRRCTRPAPRHIASLAWACAKAQVQDPKLVFQMSADACAQLDEFEPQALANLAWALATLAGAGVASDSGWLLAAALPAAALPKLREFNPQELSNIAWACVALSVDPCLVRAVAVEAVHQLAAFPMEDLSGLAWACAEAGDAEDIVLSAIAAEVAGRLRNQPLQGLAALHRGDGARRQEGLKQTYSIIKGPSFLLQNFEAYRQ